MKNTKRGNDSSRWYRNVQARAIIVAGFFLCLTSFLWAQSTSPILTVASIGTNQLSITVTNGMGGNYELLTTPVLANAAYPWTTVAVGSPNQTNFIVNIGPYPAGFYQAVWDTNAIPLWEAADPHNPSAGILTIFIDNPTNGMVLQ